MGFCPSFFLTRDDAISLDDVAIDDARPGGEPMAEVLLIKARRQMEFVQILEGKKKEQRANNNNKTNKITFLKS